MRYVNATAEFCSLPATFGEAVLRWLVICALLFPVVIADNYFHTSAPSAALGYLLGSLTVRKMLKQTEAGRKALEERGG